MRVTVSIAAFLSLTAAAFGEVKLNNIFSDNMVVQRDQPVRVFGSAAPGEAVTVTFLDKSAETKAGENGRWRVDLPAVATPGGSHTLTVKGTNAVTLKNIAVGEVWICSGQSNMEWAMNSTLNAKEEIAAADHADIRLFNVPGHISLPAPAANTPGAWQLCNPGSVPGFSAVGYFFGQKLHKEIGVPIGLIGTNWGGTRIEPWTPPVGFKSVPELADYAKKVAALSPATPEGKAAYSAYLDRVGQWVEGARGKLADGKPLGNPPGPPNFNSVQGATTIYNGMVHGLAPFSVRGAIWYQGESNAGDGEGYAAKKRALVKGWRSVFENDSLAFYWVQLANFQQPTDNPAGGGWGPVREGQRRALDLPHSGMAVIIDVGEARDIHPRNKQDVGRRLARWPLNKLYGKKDLVHSGPLYREMKIEGDKISIHFDHVGGGLMLGKKEGLEPTVPGEGKLNRFSIADKDGNWHWADAVIDGETVVVSAEGVVAPTAVRYAFESNPVGANLYNKEGLPASPFRTGK